jgi:hypothetical protein
MPSLLENRLLLQYLSAAGQDIGSGRPLGANVHKVTEDVAGATSMAKLLQQMLAGGGKVTMDRDNINIKGPVSALASPRENIGLAGPGGSSGFDYQNITPSPTGAPASASTQATQRSSESLLSSLFKGNLDVVNPSASSLGEVTPSDLAGLTPQDVARAGALGLQSADIRRQSVNDVFNNLYKVALMNEMQARTGVAAKRTAIDEAKELRLWNEALRRAPLSVPGLGQLDLATWEKLPTDVKAYSYYAFTAAGRDEEVLSFNEFKQQADPASLVQYYNLAKEDKEFEKFYFASKEAGATKISIEQQAAKKKELSWVDFENKLATNVEKQLESKAARMRIIESDDPDKATAAERIKVIERELTARGTKIIDATKEGTIITWTVVDSDGNERTFSYDIGY